MSRNQSVISTIDKKFLQAILDGSSSFADTFRKMQLNDRGGNSKTLKAELREMGLV
jgi:phage-related tail protein